MKLGIIGTGAYAIALASFLENKNVELTMWTKLKEEYDELKEKNTNLKIIDYKLDDKIKFTMNIEEAINNMDGIILAIPAKFLKETINEIKKYIKKEQHVLIATKGIESNSKKLIHDFLYDELKNNNIACISGPSFAIDIIEKEPIGLTIASHNEETLLFFTNLFNGISYLTVEPIKDIIGCELCGMLKNIVAIFSGILDGMEVNNSTNAKFLVDATKEIQNIIYEFGGNKKTFSSYAGLGDLILTCTSTKSRNYTFGKLIGEKKDFKSYQNTTTIEGLENLNTVYKLFQEKNIDCKFVNILYEIIYLDKSTDLILKYLIR